MKLITHRLILREFRESDFGAFRELETHPETYRYETARPSEQKTREYLENAQLDTLQLLRTRYRLAVTGLGQDIILGRVTLGLNNDTIREWEIGWAIHPTEWGKGIATESAGCLLDFAFMELKAHRVVAFSHAENIASLRVMRKLGMQQEGLLRETRLWQGQWSDEVVYSILDREWNISHTKDR